MDEDDEDDDDDDDDDEVTDKFSSSLAFISSVPDVLAAV